MKKEKREKKPLEGYVIANVHELFRAGREVDSPIRHTIVIKVIIPDPRCTVKVDRVGYKRSVYRFTKTTRVVPPMLVTIYIYSRSFKKRNFIKDLNGMEFTDVADRFHYLQREKEGKRGFVISIVNAEGADEDKYLPNMPEDVAYIKEHQIKINASDIENRESVLRYLFKTTDEKLSRNFVS